MFETPKEIDFRYDRDLWLLVRPLKAVYDGKMSNASGPDHVMSFKRLQHWALRVGDDYVYEVVRTKDGHEWRRISKKKWDEYNEDLLNGTTERHHSKKRAGYLVKRMRHKPVGRDAIFNIRLVGQTKMSDSELYRTGKHFKLQRTMTRA